MSWFDRLKSTFGGRSTMTAEADSSLLRLPEWQRFFDDGALPSFVEARLNSAAAGKAPWISTTAPCETMLIAKHGIRPIAPVSGTCWLHFDYSWTEGHRQGWNCALDRMRSEALVLGANAVVDVRLRTTRFQIGQSMDFTVFGTAVRVDGLPRSEDPVVSTVPALEFIRLLRAGVIPVGIAIGAHFEWSPAYRPDLAGGPTFRNRPLDDLTSFWEVIRRQALRELRRDAGHLGDGVLADIHFGELARSEERDAPGRYLGRHIVIGTAVHSRRSVMNEPLEFHHMLNLADEQSSRSSPMGRRHEAYLVSEEERAI